MFNDNLELDILWKILILIFKLFFNEKSSFKLNIPVLEIFVFPILWLFILSLLPMFNLIEFKFKFLVISIYDVFNVFNTLILFRIFTL